MPKPRRLKGLGKKGRKRAMKAANALPTHMQDIAFSKSPSRSFHKPQSFGAASAVRRIDPETGREIKVGEG